MKTQMSILSLLAFLCLRCSELGVEPPPPQMRPLTLSEQRLVKANDQFWLKLLKQVNTKDSAKNVFISPLSISFALGMTLNGAEGETQQCDRRSASATCRLEKSTLRTRR